MVVQLRWNKQNFSYLYIYVSCIHYIFNAVYKYVYKSYINKNTRIKLATIPLIWCTTSNTVRILLNIKLANMFLIHFYIRCSKEVYSTRHQIRKVVRTWIRRGQCYVTVLFRSKSRSAIKRYVGGFSAPVLCICNAVCVPFVCAHIYCLLSSLCFYINL